jgi:hypothetical protein
MSDNHILHMIIPKTKLNEFLEQPRAHYLELSSENTASVDVAKSLVNNVVVGGIGDRTLCRARSIR